MKFNSFVKSFFILNIIFLACIGFFVYIIDPFWTFPHANKFNSLQKSSNEREQKSNLLYFQDKEYDGLLLGTSRVTFLNQYDFKDIDVFNYSFSLSNPINLNEYIEFAKKQNKKDFEYIFIGLDFLGSNLNAKKNKNPEDIFEEISNPFYKYKILLSIDSVKLSFENIKRSLLNRPGGRSYNRENLAFTTNIPDNEVIKKVENTSVLEQIENLKDYKYNEKYQDILFKIKESNPNSKFIVFTTPTTVPYLNRIIKLGFYEDYKRWLKNSVLVFSSIYHFMDKNSVNTNYSKYFMDYHHIYPEYSKYIVDKLENINATTSPKDFGIKLNKSNIDSYLESLN